MAKNLRQYTVCAYSGHHRGIVAHCAEWRSSVRIRYFAVIVFRKYFGGREPSSSWGKNGFMGGASDRRGNSITVSQENWFHPLNPGSTQARRPLCPMIIRREEAA